MLESDATPDNYREKRSYTLTVSDVFLVREKRNAHKSLNTVCMDSTHEMDQKSQAKKTSSTNLRNGVTDFKFRTKIHAMLKTQLQAAIAIEVILMRVYVVSKKL